MHTFCKPFVQMITSMQTLCIPILCVADYLQTLCIQILCCFAEYSQAVCIPILWQSVLCRLFADSMHSLLRANQCHSKCSSSCGGAKRRVRGGRGDAHRAGRAGGRERSKRAGEPGKRTKAGRGDAHCALGGPGRWEGEIEASRGSWGKGVMQRLMDASTC